MENFSFCAVQFEIQYKDGWYIFFSKIDWKYTAFKITAFYLLKFEQVFIWNSFYMNFILLKQSGFGRATEIKELELDT